MKKEDFNLRTVRKKILLLTKIAGVLIILSYAGFTESSPSTGTSFFLWMLWVILLVLALDFLIGRFISKPIESLNQTARQMAELDFSSPCKIETNDEFEELSHSLNVMADNLKQALADLEREVARERLLLAERKELVDRLSHEMKTPLGVIRAYAEGLQDAAGTDEQQTYADVIISETERMDALIHTLLDLSALETGAAKLTPERFGFVEFTETAAGRLLADIPDANFKLHYDLPEKEAFVYTDKARMEQVLNNLIVNAKNHVISDGVIRLSLKEKDGLLLFSIFNQGRQIPAENLQKIWTKFYRGHSSDYNGSGLGLAITSQILSMQKLSYGARNLTDGVEFFFSIPTAE